MRITSIILFLFVNAVYCQWAPIGSVADLDDAGAVLINPAGLGVARSFNSVALFPVDYANPDSQDFDFTVTLHSDNSGFGYTRFENGNDQLHFGSGQLIDYGFYFGAMSHISRRGYEAVDLGFLWRGFPWLSVGSSWKNVYSRDKLDQPLTVGLALRPIGRWLTLSYDYFSLLTSEQSSEISSGNFIAKAELLPGINFIAGYNSETENMQLGFSLNYGIGGVENYSSFDSNGDLQDNGIIAVRSNVDRKKSLFTAKNKNFIELVFKNGIEDSPSPRAFFGDKLRTLRGTIHQLERIAEDPEISGIIIYPQQVNIGFAMMMEMREALVKLKAAGKKIYVFADILLDGQYAMVSMADGIYLNSGGVMLVDGIGMGAAFWKGTLDKLGIQAQYYRRGKYKSAAETYIRENMSEPNREAREAVLDDISGMFREMLLDRPGMNDSTLNAVFDRALFTPDLAEEYGLIDGVFHPDQKNSIISDLTGEKVKILKSRGWFRKWDYEWESGTKPKIALVYAEGPILPGRSKPSPFGRNKQIGSVTTSNAIRKAREDKSVKAIVLRVNSPGGSVLASEDIWREVQRTTNPDSSDEHIRKPLYVSMGNVAASGGYYIACAADTIVADSACITGSIGVLAGKMSLGGLFEKIGYNIDMIRANPHSDMFSLHRGFTDEEGASMQALVDSYYEQFLSRVADGRGMTRDEVDNVAQGRIWSGLAAKENGLVDELGGLEKTIILAKERLGMEAEDEVTLKIYPSTERPDFEFNLVSGSVILDELEKLDGNIDVKTILDRVSMMNNETALYLMEEIISVE